MSALAFLVWALTVHGITQIVTQSSLFTPVRKFCMRWQFSGTLIICPLCFGTWVGMLMSVGGFAPVRLMTAQVPFGFAPLPVLPAWPWWAALLFDGGLASGLAWMLHLFSGQLARVPSAPAHASSLPPPPQTVYVQHLGLPGAPGSAEAEEDEEPVATAAPTAAPAAISEAEAKGLA